MNEKKNRKKEKKKFEDDGRTVVNMNVDGFPWFSPQKGKEKKPQDRDKPTKREIFAMIIAAYKAYLPYFAIMIGAFVAAFLIAMLFLR